MNFRTEHDTMGEIQVPAERLWGAQTERSRRNFNIGAEQMPLSLIHGLVRVKKACASVNRRENLLSQPIGDLIIQVCDEILAGQHDQEFPLSVWQTGSGTQTNMNVNEVIANRAAVIDTGGCERGRPVHANDHVNLSQSSNDVFPSAMHVAAVFAMEDHLLPSLASFHQTLERKAADFVGIVKIGRTHLQDAIPLTLGQEVSGWAAMIESNQQQLREALHHLRFLAIGGTAVGTGLNAPAGFGEAVAEQLSQETGKTFYSAANKFHALTSHDQLVFASGAVKALAANMMKIANDVRWLASGPRCGLGEITIPANEPGSSIMPGKVNPTQCEMLTMVAGQVIGNHQAVTVGGMQGHLELNVFKPLMGANVLRSIELMAIGMAGFTEHCVVGLEPNRARIDELMNRSLMLVTALAPEIGYDKAAKIAKHAHETGSTLKEAALDLGYVDAATFDRLVDPRTMLGPEPKAP